MEAQIEEQLEKILPEDLARTFESAYHVLQGRTEHMDDLLKYGGTLLRKTAQRFTPTQLILGIAGLAAVAVVVINRTQGDDHEGDSHAQYVSSSDRPKLNQGQGKDKDQSKS